MFPLAVPSPLCTLLTMLVLATALAEAAAVCPSVTYLCGVMHELDCSATGRENDDAGVETAAADSPPLSPPPVPPAATTDGLPRAFIADDAAAACDGA